MLVAGGVVAAAAAGSIALAAIPAANGTITGCYSNSTGALRVVDSASNCVSGETAITWNQKGPTGPTGAKGSKGATGPTIGVIAGALDFIDASETTAYLPLGASAQAATTHAMGESVLPIAGTVRNLRVTATPHGSGSIVVTVLRNGATTPVSCTIAAPATDCSDSLDTQGFVAGDRITVSVGNGTGDYIRFVRWTAQFP